MREIVPMDEYGMFVDNHDIAKVNSVMVAKMFEKRHDDVLRSIRNLDCSAAWPSWHPRLSERATACLPSSRVH